MKLSVPAGSMPGATKNRPGLSFCTSSVTTWPASSAPPPGPLEAKPATLCAPAFSCSGMSAPSVRSGASFTGSTVIVKPCGALCAPLLSITT